MLLKLLFLFIVVPMVELWLLIELADMINWPTTIAIVVVTGMVGTALARTQGLSVIQRVKGELSEGQMPTDSLVDGVLILIAGAVLLTPGLLTDAFGLSLLIPACRRFYRRRMKEWFKRNVRVTSFKTSASFQTGNSEVIDSYVVDSPSGESETKPERLDPPQ